jgi:hypothetical protein
MFARRFVPRVRPVQIPKILTRQVCSARRIERQTPAELAMGGEEIYEITSDHATLKGKKTEIKQITDKMKASNITYKKVRFFENTALQPAILIEESNLRKLLKI